MTPSRDTTRASAGPAVRPAAREAVVYGALFAYVFWFRIHGIDEGFVLLGDQVRDWEVARRPFLELPLTGVPSSTGASTLGPAYYWVLWLIASVIGPPLDNLPHAGGVGISLFQSLADVVLAWALIRRTGSIVVSVAIVMLGATSGVDAAFSSTIWNPPISVALLKVAMAMVLAGPEGSSGTAMVVTLCAWCAAQVHTTGILVAVPLIAWVILGPLTRSIGRPRYVRAAVASAVVLILQIPWLTQMGAGRVGSRSLVDVAVAATAESPWTALRFGQSAMALDDGLAFILMQPWTVSGVLAAVAAGGLVAVALSRDPRMAVAGPLPVALALVGFGLWRGSYQMHWMLVLGPPAAICLLAWIAWLPGRWRTAVGLAALGGIGWLQPAKFEQVRVFNAAPGYGAQVNGCRQVIADGRALGAVAAAMPVAQGNPMWLCAILGLRLTAHAPEAAIIQSDGSVQYVSNR
jgi:hypothetical protein